MHNENWDDLRFVLTVAKCGTVSAAARELGVNHATVLRRVASFEERNGAELFEKTPRGYFVPEERRRVIAALEDVEAATAAVSRLMQGRRNILTGLVRITATDTFAQYVLPPVLSELRAAEDGLSIEVLTSNEHLDISRLRAEIAIRPTVKLPDDLQGDKAGEMRFGIYGTKGAQYWLGLTGPLERSVAGQWMASNVPDRELSGAADSFVTLAAMVARGDGIALMPNLFAQHYPELVDMAPANFSLKVPVYVACHVDLAESNRLRAVRRAIANGIRSQLALY